MPDTRITEEDRLHLELIEEREKRLNLEAQHHAMLLNEAEAQFSKNREAKSLFTTLLKERYSLGPNDRIELGSGKILRSGEPTP